MKMNRLSGQVIQAGQTFDVFAFRNGARGGKRHLVKVIHGQGRERIVDELDYRSDYRFTVGLLRRGVIEFWAGVLHARAQAKQEKASAAAVGAATALVRQDAG